MYQMGVMYSKWLYNISNFTFQGPPKIYPNYDFWFENIPSGNPARIVCFLFIFRSLGVKVFVLDFMDFKNS
jgi:hypothetical protein